MLPWLGPDFGNAASRAHTWGWRADAAVKQARELVCEAIGAEEGELIFTSGATEALNLAIKGLASSWREKKKHLICWATDHKAVLDVCKALARDGFETTILPVLSSGLPDEAAFRAALRPDTLLVCGLLANNETGVVFPIAQLASWAHDNGSFFLCDATQAVGKIPVEVKTLGADLVALSAHKFYGPKGVGALWVAKRPGLKLQALLHGGGHEAGLRSGTLNVPGIVGMGKAAALSQQNLQAYRTKLTSLQSDLEAGLRQALPEIYILGEAVERLPNTTNVCFTGCAAAAIIKSLRHLGMATGSACSSASASPSHVLMAMGLSSEQAASCLRISLGWLTTEDEVRSTINDLAEAVNKAREESPHWLYR